MTSVLNEALEVVTGPRQEAYGDPVVTCERIGRVWSGILGLSYDLPAATVSALMVGLKMVRETSGEGSRDNWVDAAGYAHIGALAREDAIPFDEPLPSGRTVFEGTDLRSDGLPSVRDCPANGGPCPCLPGSISHAHCSTQAETARDDREMERITSRAECPVDCCTPTACGAGCLHSDLETEDVRLRAERAAWEERTKVSLTPFSVNATATSADELARRRHNAAILNAANGNGPYPPSLLLPSVWANDGSGEAEAAVRREAKEAEREEKLRLAKHFSQGIRPTRLRVER